MYCPKCGAEAVEGQRFCKACGTNLQLIINIVKGGGSKGPGPWNVDPEELKRNITEFVDSWKKGFQHEHPRKWKADWVQYQRGRPYRQDARELRRRARDEVRRRNLPQPGQWMRYSRQHNFKEGLVSLLSGAGLSYVFFKIGQEVLNAGIIHEIPRINDAQAHGLEVLARIFWLFMLIPALKGLGHLFYATFFAEPLATLSERYTIPADQLSLEAPPVAEPVIKRNTAPQAPVSAPTRDFEPPNEPPSVTENTTQFFEEAGAPRRREGQ